MKPVCLVIGAGAGIGGTVARRFAKEGYHACLCRRTDQDGLEGMVAEIEAEGGSASGFLLNAVDEGAIEDRIAAIESDVGGIEVAVYNLGAQIGDRTLSETSYKAFEMGWRMGTFGLFRLASAVSPHMEARGKGVLLVTSATAAMRGNAGQHSHAAAMGGRRMLCQTLNAELSSKGIHVAHIIIDGAVDADGGAHVIRQHVDETRHDLDLSEAHLLEDLKISILFDRAAYTSCPARSEALANLRIDLPAIDYIGNC